MTPLLQLIGISKSFGAVHALRKVDFELLGGEIHAVVGENGAGKSTLIKIITGVHSPDAGRILLRGGLHQAFTPAEARQAGIACIYQQPALFPDLTVSENISLRLDPPSPFRRVHWANVQARARRLLDGIGARFSPETEVRSLTMPEQQLVEIACALGAGSRLVIMDEPTASLTRHEQQLLFKVVRDLKGQGLGIIYISHRLEEILALADRVTVLRDGETVGTRSVPGPPPIREPELIQLMVGRDVETTSPRETASPASHPSPVLSVERLGCRATGLHDVSLELHAGVILGVAGMVGAGRTELAQSLFGLEFASSGTIRLDGKVVTIRSPKEAIDLGIAYLPEDRRRHGVILEMPIQHNISMAVHPRVFPGGWIQADRERMLASGFIQRLEIKAESPDAAGMSLSGGNQQKVALSRWLATQPKVLLLDEPTQGVDVGAKAEIHQIIRRLADEGVAILWISSDLPELLAVSDRIAVMYNRTLAGFLPAGCPAEEVMALALGGTALTETA